MKIHELAHLSGVNPETIRMYRQKGLLHPARLANGYFDYSACNLYELMFVRKLRGANLGLETIASFYAEDGQAGALRNMKQEIRALVHWRKPSGSWSSARSSSCPHWDTMCCSPTSRSRCRN